MIGAISDAPHRPNRCNRCRHWVEDMTCRDPNNADWGFGECRQSAPTLVSSMVGVQIDKPRFGQQDDLDVGLLQLCIATRFPVTSSTDWCGRFEATDETTDAGHAEWLRERNALIDYLDGPEPDEQQTNDGCGRLNRLDTQIMDTPATTTGDAIAKLVLLAQISIEGHEVPEQMAVNVLSDVAPIVGIGRVSRVVANLVREA